MVKAMALEPPAGAKAAWMADAGEAIETLARRARQSNSTFSSDELRRMVDPPDHPSWAGHAFTAARTRGIIKPVGWRISTSRSRSGGPVRVWRAAGK